jgi:hypothetical protein
MLYSPQVGLPVNYVFTTSKIVSNRISGHSLGPHFRSYRFFFTKGRFEQIYEFLSEHQIMQF